MRSTLAIVTVAAAAATVSASNCNPSYNTPGSGACFTNCNINAGQTFVKGWTIDPASPLFLDSLKLMCSKGTSEYTAFMTTAGMCMAKCSDDPQLFNAEFAGACTWYAAHKNDTCADPNGTATNSPNESYTGTTTNSNAATNSNASTSSSADSATSSTSGANKLSLTGYAAALVAAAAYFGL